MKNKEIKTKNSITTIARGMIYLMAFAVFAVCAFLFPELAREEKVSNPSAGPALPFLIGAWVLSLPIFAALNEALKITNYIDKNTAFSILSVKAIQKIKTFAVLFAALIVASAISIVVIGKNVDPAEDYAPVISVGFVFTFTSCVIAAFAAVLERLLKDAINMKEENDLIV